MEVCRQLDVHIPEQVIEVPKVSSPSRPCRRRVAFAEQTAEQLVEVPTIISCSSLLQRTVEQNVVTPVPDRGARYVGLQGFPDRQSSTAQLASQKRSTERIVEQIVDFRVLGGGLQDFRPVQGSSASSSSSREHAGEEVFRTFPRVKKSPKVSPHSGSELSADFNPSTLSAHQMAPSGLLWSQDECTESASPRWLLEICPFLGFARALRTWKMVHYSPASCGQLFLGV